MKKLPILILILIFLFLTFSNAQDATEREIRGISNKVNFLIRKLNSPRQQMRIQALRELEKLPLIADQFLIKKVFELENERQILLIITALINRKCPRAPTIIVQLFNKLPHHTSLLIDYLRYFKTEGWKAIKWQLFDNPLRPNRQPIVEQAYTQFIRVEIIKAIENYFNNERKFRFHPPSFYYIRQFGSSAMDILFKIARDENDFIKNNMIIFNYNVDEVQAIAIKLVEKSGVKTEYVFAELKKYRFYLTTVSYYHLRKERLEKFLFLALYHLGFQRNPAENLARRLEVIAENANIQQTVFSFIQWKQAGDFYYRLHNNEKAIYCYEKGMVIVGKLIKRRINNYINAISDMFHTLAEIYVYAQDYEKAISTLKQILEINFASVTWELIFNNRNLINLWETKNFKEWIGQCRQDPAYVAIMPKEENPGYAFSE